MVKNIIKLMFLFTFMTISASFLLYLFSQEEDEIEDFDMRNICPNEEYV
jgi:hypothetical protein